MQASKREQRRHPRKIFTTTVQYYIADTATDSPAKGVTVNISKSGLCLYTFSEHDAGQQLKIVNGTPVHMEEHAVVRWVKKINDHLFKLGCEFSQLQE